MKFIASLSFLLIYFCLKWTLGDLADSGVRKASQSGSSAIPDGHGMVWSRKIGLNLTKPLENVQFEIYITHPQVHTLTIWLEEVNEQRRVVLYDRQGGSNIGLSAELPMIFNDNST